MSAVPQLANFKKLKENLKKTENKYNESDNHET